MNRVDPITCTPLLNADYRYAVRRMAFDLLAAKQYDALEALWSSLSDSASEAFTSRDHAMSDEMRTYWASVRRDALDLLGEVEAAFRHVPGNPVSGC